MANKYIRHGETYCGDGTTSAAAASDGAVGAWNNINVFEGTAPAYGALAAGDTVYTRSKDVGTEIILDCGVSIASSTVRKIIARTPNGTIKQWTSSLEGTNSIKYTIVDGDLDRPGEWQLSAYVEMPGWKGSGEITKLTVKQPLNI